LDPSSEEIYSKSTIFDFLLVATVTLAVLLNVCEIFSRVAVDNRHFRPLYSDCKLPSGGTPSNNNVIYASQKCKWAIILSLTVVVYLHLVSRYCLPNLRNHAKIRENWNS